MGNIFHITENNEAIQLQEAKYESENDFQQLIENHPEILAGEQINPDVPRKWILVSREMGVPACEGGSDQWFLDHLFLDQDGIPTLVEVKRSTDTRIRREVVAQMLDYAANATAYWPVSRLREAFEAQPQNENATLSQKFGIALEEEDAYWEKVESNLRLAKLRLMFVADEIPSSLLRIIEFLNSQLVDTEVLGLEIKQYLSTTNQRTLVPKLLGQTAAALQIKKPNDFQWTEDSFLDRVRAVSGKDAADICQHLLNDFRKLNCHIQWGRGRVQGGFTPVYLGTNRHRIAPVYSYNTSTKVEILFNEMKAPFNQAENKNKLIVKFRGLGILDIPDDPNRPSFDINLLSDLSVYQRFMNVCREMISEIQQFEQNNL